MHYSSRYLDYRQTGFFSKIILDYLSQSKQLTPFFLHTPDLEGVKQSIAQRQNFATDRTLLVNVLQSQYADVNTASQVKKNIELLASANTFTICTAHQPNIFTGHLYFIYKILHTIKIAEHLNSTITGNNFVPVFYMGSEDADLQELNHIYIDTKRYEWQTKQTGAVGKMLVDKQLIKLIDDFSGQLTVLPFGKQLIEILKSCFTEGISIQQATLKLVDFLFQDYGLVVLIPDNANLKRLMLPLFEDDIFKNTPSQIVYNTSKELNQHYKVQAHPREINLFYFKDNIRNRLVVKNNIYYVEDTDITFTSVEIRSELNDHPERFSPNVILRGLYQETILPNLVFIGGGGELAYWLELKELFANYKVPYPVLILRNSFLLINKNIKNLHKKLNLDIPDLFKGENVIINELVKKESTHQLYLTLEKQQIRETFDEIKKATNQIDSTLIAHTEAMLAKTLKKLEALERKMLKAEKRKFEAQQRQIKKIKAALFPNESLQERVENFMPYYAKYGREFFKLLYENSSVFQQAFCVLNENEP